MSQPPRSFHAAHAPARVAPPPAAPLTLDDVAAAAAAALAQDPEVREWNWWFLWKRYMDEHGSEWARSDQSTWLASLYSRRAYNPGRGVAQMVLSPVSPVDALIFYLPRLTDGELAECRAQAGWSNNPLVKAEVRRRATPAELQAMKEVVPIDHSHVMTLLSNRLGGGPRPGEVYTRHIRTFFASPPSGLNHPVHPLQTFRTNINILRGQHHTLHGFASACIDTLVDNEVWYSGEMTSAARATAFVWDGIIAHLTIRELAAVVHILEAGGPNPGMFDNHQFRIRFLQSYEDIRLQRAHLAASGLIQRLARRDADAANYLASMVTRTVNLRNPGTHIATRPTRWDRADRARNAMRERRDAIEEDRAVAGHTRGAEERKRRKKEDEERKHDEE